MEAIETLAGDYGYTATVNYDNDRSNPFTDWDMATVYVSESNRGLRQGGLFSGYYAADAIGAVLGMVHDINAGRKVKPADYGFDQAELNLNGSHLDDFLSLLDYAKEIAPVIVASEQFNIGGGETFWIIATVDSLAICGCAHENAKEIIRQDFETYRQYVEGDVYYVLVEGPDGEIKESISGLFGLEYAIIEAETMLADCVATEVDAIAFEREAFAL